MQRERIGAHQAGQYDCGDPEDEHPSAGRGRVGVEQAVAVGLHLAACAAILRDADRGRGACLGPFLAQEDDLCAVMLGERRQLGAD